MSKAPDVAAVTDQVLDAVGRVIVGKRTVTTYILAALWAGRHVLIEDVPGVGKTTLAKAISSSLGLDFQRIQFTPDLVPADITGVFTFDQSDGSFHYRPGPIMSQVVLADEINRASPKTQSSLLEAMQERQITVDRETMELPRPFLVLATQNPVEFEGTFPLPEAQVDRFACRISLGYPDQGAEIEMLGRRPATETLSELQPVTDSAGVLELEACLQDVHVSSHVRRYIVGLSEATRSHPDVTLGASPRASLHLMELSRSLAAIRGRDYVLPDDVKELAPAVLAHRLIIKAESLWDGVTSSDVVRAAIQSTPVPHAEVGGDRG